MLIKKYCLKLSNKFSQLINLNLEANSIKIYQTNLKVLDDFAKLVYSIQHKTENLKDFTFDLYSVLDVIKHTSYFFRTPYLGGELNMPLEWVKHSNNEEHIRTRCPPFVLKNDFKIGEQDLDFEEFVDKFCQILKLNLKNNRNEVKNLIRSAFS